MSNKLPLIFILFFISCSAPKDAALDNNSKDTAVSTNQNTDNDRAQNTQENTGAVKVLCLCNKSYILGSGSNKTAAENKAKEDCKSFNASAHSCKVIN